MADQKMGSWPVFRNNSAVEQKLMTESFVTKSSNKSLSLKEVGNYHKTKTAFWGSHAAPSCTHLLKQESGYVEVFLSFPLNASWFPALSCGDLLLFQTPSTWVLRFRSAQWSPGVWKALLQGGPSVETKNKRKALPRLQEHDINLHVVREH